MDGTALSASQDIHSSGQSIYTLTKRSSWGGKQVCLMRQV